MHYEFSFLTEVDITSRWGESVAIHAFVFLTEMQYRRLLAAIVAADYPTHFSELSDVDDILQTTEQQIWKEVAREVSESACILTPDDYDSRVNGPFGMEQVRYEYCIPDDLCREAEEAKEDGDLLTIEELMEGDSNPTQSYQQRLESLYVGKDVFVDLYDLDAEKVEWEPNWSEDGTMELEGGAGHVSLNCRSLRSGGSMTKQSPRLNTGMIFTVDDDGRLESIALTAEVSGVGDSGPLGCDPEEHWNREDYRLAVTFLDSITG